MTDLGGRVTDVRTVASNHSVQAEGGSRLYDSEWTGRVRPRFWGAREQQDDRVRVRQHVSPD